MHVWQFLSQLTGLYLFSQHFLRLVGVSIPATQLEHHCSVENVASLQFVVAPCGHFTARKPHPYNSFCFARLRAMCHVPRKLGRRQPLPCTPSNPVLLSNRFADFSSHCEIAQVYVYFADERASAPRSAAGGSGLCECHPFASRRNDVLAITTVHLQAQSHHL